MKRLAYALLAVISAAVALPAQGRFAGGLRGGPGPGFGPMGGRFGAEERVTGAPYSGVRTTSMQETLANGNVISRQEQSKVYRDSEGRVRVETTTTNTVTGKTHTSVTITDPVAGASYMLDPEAKTYTRAMARMFSRPAGAGSDGSASVAVPGRRGGNRAQTPGRGRGSAEVQSEDLGIQSVEGQPATGTRMTETIPAGGIGNQQPIQVVRETWVSTVLHVPVMIKTSDPRFGSTTMVLSNVTMGEPDPALFQPPSDYTLEGGRGARGAGRRPPAQ
ncbi:MAG TPA: hypothetical protein VMU19_13195 [Bryobacteraceae bacterium]|nr:hypothetical protein [Bryobacteraceae bacterium]